MGRFTLTDDAREDLREIKGHSLSEFGTRQTKLYLNTLRDTMNSLATHPAVGHAEDSALWPGILSYPCVSHMIYYLSSPAGGIEIIGIIHQSRMPKILLKRKP